MMTSLRSWKNSLLSNDDRGGLQLNELDGVRGVAVLFVLFSHLANEGLVLSPIVFSGANSGQIGVYLFFSLSSFLLTRALVKKANNGMLDFNAWISYSSRRITRIYPFYIVVIIFAILATKLEWDLFNDMSYRDAFDHVLLTKGFLHLWTIATEIKFYLILPILILIYQKIFKKKSIRFIVFLAVLMVVFHVLSVFILKLGRGNIIKYLPIFLSGSIVAVIVEMNHGLFFSNKYKNLFFHMSYLLLFSIVLLMPKVFNMVSDLMFSTRVPFPNGSILLWGIICGLFLISIIFSKKSNLKLLLVNPVLRLIGNMSFSLYLNHWFVLKFIVKLDIPLAVQILMFWVLTIIVSIATYMFIERPFSKIKIYNIK